MTKPRAAIRLGFTQQDDRTPADITASIDMRGHRVQRYSRMQIGKWRDSVLALAESLR